jgi:hypothetical protein
MPGAMLDARILLDIQTQKTCKKTSKMTSGKAVLRIGPNRDLGQRSRRLDG